MFKIVLITTQIFVVVAIVSRSEADTEPPQEWVIRPQMEILTVTPPPTPSTEADSQELYCLKEAIYFEGRSESIDGMVAIGNVIMNRVASEKFPNTVCEVVRQGPMDGSPITRNRCQFSYFCDGKSDDFPVNDTYPELEAVYWIDLLSKVILFGGAKDLTNGGTYYHAKYASPFWKNEFRQVASIDEHLFYVPE